MAIKLGLIKRNTEEIVTEELLSKKATKKSLIAYCGYEPSGPVHLGHFVTLMKVMDCEKAGCKTKILLADLHAILNRKGTKEEIAKQVAIWKKTIKALGLKSEIVIGSEFQLEEDYQLSVMSLAQHTTVNRGLRSMQEVARDFDNATISQLWYPLMQAADIKFLNVDIAIGGLEQRKVHMIGKDLSALDHEFVALHTPLITSLKGPGQKMSKSIPGSGISFQDSKEEIDRAIKNAYCPEKDIKDNPILQICKLILFPLSNKLEIKRPEKFGGNLSFKDYESLESAYSSGKLHPLDLKNSVATELENMIAPIRKKIK